MYNCLFSQLKADFSLDKVESCDFIVPQITNNSKQGSSTIKSYIWDLAGTVLTFDNPTPPSRQFFKPGLSTICLTVVDQNNNTDKVCKNIIIYSLPIIDISANISSGCAPLTVEFNNKSFSPNGDLKQITWGIGGTANIINSTNPNQVVNTTYNSPGRQSVTISVIDDKNCVATKTFNSIVNVVTPKEVLPTVTFVQTCKFPWIVVIKNANEEVGANYNWSFGNGKTFSGAQPDTVLFENEGSFDLIVKASLNECSKDFVFKNFINTTREKNLRLSEDSICFGDKLSLFSDQIFPNDKVSWIVNDKFFSSKNDTSITFQNTGCNNIKVIRNRNNCIDTIEKKCFYVKEKPKANYNLTGLNNCLLPSKVLMNGSGEGKWTWKNDNRRVDSTSGSFVFANFGDYKISLNIEGTNGCSLVDSFDAKIKKFEVNLPRLGPQGCAPKQFLLQDSITSDLPIVSYNWTIYTKDTLSFMSKSPNFTITDTGRYDLRLIVQNSIGCIDTVSRGQYIGVGIKPEIKFDADPRNDCRKTARKFKDLSSKYANFWFWEFGDGGTSLSQHPEYKYNDTGYFDVTLLAGQNGCFSSLEIDSFIYVKAPIVSWSPVINCDDPLNVKLTGNEIASDTTFWVIDYLGAQSTDTIRRKTIDSLRFPDFGKYLVGIYGENFTTGCTDDQVDTLFLTNPVAFYEIDKYKSCIPLVSNVIVRGNRDIDTIELYWQGEEIFSNQLNMPNSGIYPTPIMVGKDRYGCPDTFKIDSVLIANKIIPNVSVPNAVCIPDSFSVVNHSISEFGNIIGAKWTFDGKVYQGDSLILYLDTASTKRISLHVLDDFGCEITIEKSFQGIDLKPRIIRDSLGCTSGPINISAGGTTAFTKDIEWTFGNGDSLFNIASVKYPYKEEGKYEICLTLFDERGCERSICDSITIIDPVAEFFGDSLLANCPPLLTNFTNKSKNATTYRWSFGDGAISDFGNPSHIYNKVDTFDVMLIASNSSTCHDTLLLEEYVIVRGPQAKIYPEFLSNCSPLVVKLNIESDKPYFYLWDNDIGSVEKPNYTSTKDSRIYTYDKPGKYKPRAIVTNDEGCSLVFQSAEFEVNEIKSDFLLDDFPLCEGIVKPSIQNKTTGTTKELTYTWILEREGFSAIRFDSLPHFTLRDRGHYKLTLISQGQNCIDTAFKEDFVFVGSPPVPNFNLPNILCENLVFDVKQQVDTTLQGQMNFIWKNQHNKIIGTSDSIQISIDTFGTLPLKLIVINEANCIDSISKNIFLNPGLKIGLPPDTTVCIDQPVSITNSVKGSNISNFTLSNSTSLICNNCLEFKFTPIMDDFYYLMAINNVGCEYRDTMQIKVAPVRSPDFELIQPSKICKDSIASINLSRLENDWIAIWQKPNGDTICNGNCPRVNYQLKDGEQIKVTVKNATYLCTTEKTSQIGIESSIPDFLVDNRTVCLGDSVKLNAKDGAIFKWNVNGHSICNECKEIAFLPSRPTIATLKLISATGCPYTDSVLVNVFDKRFINAGPDTTVCVGSTISFSGAGFGSVLWTPSDKMDDPTSFRPKTTIDHSSVYHMTTTIDQCILSDSLLVRAIPKIDLHVTNDTICPRDIGKILFKTNGNNISYTIGPKPRNEKFLQDTLIILPEMTTKVVWKSTFPTCKDVFDTSYVVVKQPIYYYLTKKYYEVSYNNIKQVEAKYDTQQVKQYDITWTASPSLSCADCPRPFVSDITDDSKFYLDIYDRITGCSISDSIFARQIKKCTPDGFFLPNIMRLSSVSGNDKFDFNAHKLEHFRSLHIYDRWGNNVFYTNDVAEKWDGTFNGEKVEQGVYVVKITANCPENLLDYVIIGDVTVIE